METIPVAPTHGKSWQRRLTVALLLLFVALSVQYTFKVAGSDKDNRSAILRWRSQIQDIEYGVNVYDLYDYPNPPVMALLLQPVVTLPPLAGSLLWFYLKVGMAFLVFHWVLKMVETPDHPFPVWAKILAILLSLRPIMGDLTHGNINIFILFLVVGALYAYRDRQDVLAGLVLGLAIACKVTPALFVPYFLWKRAWGLAAGCGLGLVLFLWVVPGSILGFETNNYLLGRWADRMIVPYALNGQVTTEHQNQSLPGLLHRLLTPVASFSNYDWETDTYIPVECHNLVDLDPAIPQLMIKALLIAFAVLVMWCCRTPTGERHGWRPVAEYGVIILGMLLFSERTWKHHCVTLVLPFTVLVYYLATQRTGPGLRRYLIGTVVVVVLLMVTTGTGLFGADADRLAKLFQVYGAYVWAYVILAASLFVLLRNTAKSLPVVSQTYQIHAQRVVVEDLDQLPAVRDRGAIRQKSPCGNRALPL